MSGAPRSVAVTQTTRPPVPAPTTLDRFIAALYRGFDEGPHAQRAGDR